MNKIIVMACLFLSLIASIQQQMDSLLFSRLNNYRISHGITTFKPDTTCMRDEAQDIATKLNNQDSLKAGRYVKGIYGYYLYFEILYDGELDSISDGMLVEELFKQFIDARRERRLLELRDLKYDVCVVRSHEVYSKDVGYKIWLLVVVVEMR